jgi:hypothetical protein
MAVTFQKTGDANYPRFMNILLMGPPKSGKTTFISTMPNVVVADCEAGLMSIAHLDVPYMTIDGTDKLQTMLLILQDEKLRASTAKQLGLPSIESVAIDTSDALQEIMKRDILKENRRTQMQRDDWGTLKERMTSVIKAFTALPMNVVITVHTEVTQDENQRQIYAPNLQGGIKNDIAGMVDFSLMAFRQKETDDQGISRIKYYLKNEGDEKNPHLGNRSQGRVPEVCDPDFKTLHALTFAGINPKTIEEEPDAIEITAVTSQPEASQPPTKTEEVAQSESQASDAQKAKSKPSGVPAVDDAEKPINAAGISTLTKHYEQHGLVKPTDLESWTLGKARGIAKFFVAWKADASTNKATREDLIAFLQAAEAYVATKEEVSTPVQTEKTPAKTTPAEVTKPKAVAEETSTPEPEPTHDEAVGQVQEQLGGVVIGQTVGDDAKCEVCDKPVDDKDVAQLALTRYQKVLCVSDYKEMTRK